MVKGKLAAEAHAVAPLRLRSEALEGIQRLPPDHRRKPESAEAFDHPSDQAFKAHHIIDLHRLLFGKVLSRGFEADTKAVHHRRGDLIDLLLGHGI